MFTRSPLFSHRPTRTLTEHDSTASGDVVMLHSLSADEVRGKMPQPIKGKINIKIAPAACATRPELASRIAVISSMWSEIEDEIAFLYALAMRTEPAWAAATLGRVSNLGTRLDMLETALELSFSQPAATRFRTLLRKPIRDRAGERARVIHCHWAVHDRYPDDLIRVVGITDPSLHMERYDLKDFLSIELRLLKLLLSLKEFAQSLIGKDTEEFHGRDYWRMGPRENA